MVLICFERFGIVNSFQLSLHQPKCWTTVATPVESCSPQPLVLWPLGRRNILTPEFSLARMTSAHTGARLNTGRQVVKKYGLTMPCMSLFKLA